MQPQEDDKWLKYSQLNKEHFNTQFISFSLISSLISHPLAVVAVRQQAGDSVTGETYKKGNMLSVLRQSYKSIGLKGLYRGWMPMATLGIPSNLIYISTLEISREYFQKSFKTAFPSLSPYSIDLMQAIASSVIANAFSIVPYVPAEVLSSRLMIQGKDGLNTRDMAKQIYREQGVKSFFKGFNSSLLVGIVLSSQWWFTYSSVKRLTQSLPSYEQYSLGYDAFTGMAAGMTGAAVAHPFDTIKTRIMVDSEAGGGQYKKFIPTLVDTVRKEGVQRLFKGLPAVLYQSALGSTVFALCYEFMKRRAHATGEKSGDVVGVGIEL
jgi:hypothetical protein